MQLSQKNGRAEGNHLNWDVILFFALYVIMPSYFGIEFHEKLPLITVSRMVLLLMGLMLLIQRRGDLFKKSNLNLGLTTDPFLRVGLLLYFALLLIANIVFISETTEAVKAIFVLAAEEYALVWLLSQVIDTRGKLLKALQILIYASGVTAVVACISCIVDSNLFELLNTITRDAYVANYYRLGLLRAEAGFNHPVYYGAYCAAMIPLCMYFIENGETTAKRIVNSGCLVLNFVALVLSNSRGSMVAFCALVVVLFFVYLAGKKLKKLFATYLPLAAVAIAVLVLVASLSPVGISYLTGTVDSMLNIIHSAEMPTDHLSDPVPTTLPSVTEPPATTLPPVTEPPATTLPPVTEPPATTLPPVTEPPVDFGRGEMGLYSRLYQLSGIEWALMHNPVFGFGPAAHIRGLIQYQYTPGKWTVHKTFDISFVAIVCQYGIVGLLGFLALYGSVFKTVVTKKYWKDKLMPHLFFAVGTYYVCLLSITSVDKLFWVIVGLLICLVNILRKEKA